MLKHLKMISKLAMMKVLLSLSFVSSVSGQGSFCSSPVENVHFELVTGKVFTAPEDMLDSRPGTLMLTDCIDLCRANTTCRAANFETGLCVLFSSSAQQFPGGLTTSQFPVFTIYIQKLCLPSPTCRRAWTFESVEGYAMDQYAKKRGRLPSRENCMALCRSEKDFPCRSASYSSTTGECRISDMDRHTVAGTTAFQESIGDEYLENNCVDDPVKLCDFQLLENRIMKTVDSVYQDVPTMEACRDLCLTAPYRCHSFDYGDTGDRVCRLSHHTSTTLTQIQDPFLVIGDVRGTFELSSCYNVTIDCRSSDMVATITTNKIFTGKIYAKDNPNSCVVDVKGDIEFSIKMAYNDIECDVKREALGVYTNQVIIQHHDSVVTSSDLGLALHCQYDLGNKTVTNGLDLEVKGEIQPALVEQGTVESPTVAMSVTARGGGKVERAQVGDPLELHFTILDTDSPYEVFVRELIAKDGNDQNEIVLLDSNGCPTEGQIMGPLAKEKGNPKSLVANFDAFKFPTSEVVQFRALVTPCMPRCQPVECVYQDFYGGDNTRITSYGRKKRSATAPHTQVLNFDLESPFARWTDGARSLSKRSQSAVSTGEEVLVTHAFMIVDKFDKKKKSRTEENKAGYTSRPDNSGASRNHHEYFDRNSLPFQPTEKEELFDPNNLEVCLNVTGLIAGVAVFLIIQLILVFVWTHFWQTRNKKKRNTPSTLR